MRIQDVARLTILAAIWGSSFVFMRVAAPALGPLVTADLRVLLAGLLLAFWFRIVRFDPQWMRFWKHYLIVGVVNSALPFSLYSYAALHIPASYSVILNATAPLFGAVFAAIWLGDRLTSRKLAGLAIGTCGVALVARAPGARLDAHFASAIAACLGAAVCYGLAGVYIKRRASMIAPLGMAGASQLMAGLALLPLASARPPAHMPGFAVILSIMALAVLCSAVAYLLYYRLVVDVGPARALTVTFLMPVFGMVWGAVFLSETITPSMVFGCALVIGGTFVVLQAGGGKLIRDRMPASRSSRS